MEHNGVIYKLQPQKFNDLNCDGCAFSSMSCCLEEVGMECSKYDNFVWVEVVNE